MKLLKKFRILLSASSLLLFACNKPIHVDVCVIDVAAKGLQCVKPDNGSYFVPFEASDNFISFSPEDARTLIEACGIKGSNRARLEHYYLERFANARSVFGSN